jgi:hypothetical protein
VGLIKLLLPLKSPVQLLELRLKTLSQFLPKRRILSLLIISHFSYGQSLTKERIERLKNSTVKITIENDNTSGTGFYFSEDGAILTCWHVIDPAIVKDSLDRVVSFKKIFILDNKGNKFEFGIPMVFVNDPALNFTAVANDFCVLIPDPKLALKVTSFLKLGNFNNIEEGDEVYTSGYPLGLPYQFVSRGTLSTKYIDSTLVYRRKSFPDKKVKRSAALLDLTINKGNSGGAIVKLGVDLSDDEVVGIVNFNINPFGANAQNLNERLSQEQNLTLPSGKISITESMMLFSNAIIYSSNGISGCISINHFLQALK